MKIARNGTTLALVAALHAGDGSDRGDRQAQGRPLGGHAGRALRRRRPPRRRGRL